MFGNEMGNGMPLLFETQIEILQTKGDKNDR